jgi:predicted SAM-dependent methyltransferase
MKEIVTKSKAVAPPWAKDAARVIRKRSDFLSESVKEAADNLWTEIKFSQMARRSERRFQEIKGRQDLKINLGCGHDIKKGWLNIDLRVPSIGSDLCRETGLISYDLRLGLPLENHSCSFIYSSHFFEHLEFRHGLKLMTDCHRVLKTGGTFRLALPDYRRIFRAYIQGNCEYFSLIDDRWLGPMRDHNTATAVDYVNYAVYQHGEHKFIYDEDKLILLLQALGYSSVSRTGHKEGLDSGEPVRRRYSLFVEAIK